MPRIHSVMKAAKDQGNCSVCGQPIPAGSAYKWAAPRAGKFARGRKIKAHSRCQFRPSQLTTSEIKGNLYDAQESAQSQLRDAQTVDDLKAIAEETAEVVREIASAAREKAENIESGMGHAMPASDELNERADAIEAWADSIGDVDFEGFEIDGSEAVGILMEGGSLDEEYKTRFDEWLDEQRGTLESVLSECPE